MKVSKTEKAEQLAKLREWMPEGSTVYTIICRVSASGMSRVIRLVILTKDADGRIYPLHPNYTVSRALGFTLVRVGGCDGLRVSGCGMDMGFHLVDSISHALYGKSGALKHSWL